MPAPDAASIVPMLASSLHRPHVPCPLLHPLPTVTKRHRRAAEVATSRRRRHGARGLGRGLQLGPKRLWGREGGGQGRGQRWKSLESGEAEGVSYCRRAILSFNCSAAVVCPPAALGKGRRSRPRPSARAADRSMGRLARRIVAFGCWMVVVAKFRLLLYGGCVVQVFLSSN